MITQRTVAERVKLERLEAIAIEAAEQCGRTLLPEIAEPLPLIAFLELDGRTPLFRRRAGGEPVACAFKPGPATILTGPEGGFTDEERAAIRAAPNAVADLARPAHPSRRDRRARRRLAAYMALAGDWR